MKLVRFGARGAERPGLIDEDGQIRDLSALIPDITGAVLSPEGLDALKRVETMEYPAVSNRVRLGPPVTQVGKIVCVGLNYFEHARESNMAVPEEPVLFTKATSAINGPYDPIVLPPGASKADWEVELVAVIGRRASHVTEEHALRHVAGYCIGNDISERAFQLEGSGQWVKGKSCDSFAPIGPWLVTADEVPDPQVMDIWLEVNGQRYQNSNCGSMIFSVATLISFISRFMSLLPGDLVFTGTPPGVGLGQEPAVWLTSGDVIRCGISDLGEQTQRVVDWENRPDA